MTLTKPIRIGFVGLSANGRWAASALAPPLLKEPLSSSYKLTAVSTSNETSASESAKKYTEQTGNAVKGYYGDTSAISADPNVDFVVVAVKVPAHKDAILPAIKAGKSVFSEFPLGRDVEEARELADEARKAGVKTMVGLQGWQSPVVAKVREWIAEGKIGQVLGVNWITSKPADFHAWGPIAGQDGSWNLDPSKGATMLSIIVGHDIGAITRMFGPITSINATAVKTWPTVALIDSTTGKPTGQTAEHPAPDHYAVAGTFKQYPGALFNGTWRSGTDIRRPGLSVVIDGTKGYIRWETFGLYSNLHIAAPSKVYVNDEEVSFEGDVPFVRNTGRAWAEFAKGEEGVWPTFDDAVAVHKVLDAIEKSSKEGSKVSLDV